MGPHTSSAKHLPWSGARRSTWQAYALAVLATVATVAVRIALTPWVHERPTLILFALPIALSAYVGGLGPGLVCTVLVTLASAFFVLPATQGLSLSRPEDVAQLGLLAGVGLVLSFMNSATLRPGAVTAEQSRGGLTATMRKVQGGFAFALALLIAVGGVCYFSLLRLTENARMVAHSYEVLGHLSVLQSLEREARDASQAFSATGDESFLQTHVRSLRVSREEIEVLRELTGDNPAQQRRVGQLANLADAQERLLARVTAARRENGGTAAAQLVSTEGARISAALDELLPAMSAIEQRLLEERENDAADSGDFARSVIVAGGLLALLLVAGALYAIRRDLAGRLSAEAELERFFSLSLDFLCISSSDGYFKRVSPAVTDMLGWSVAEFLREPYLHWIHPDDHPATLREVERQMQTGEGVLKFENRYRHKDGSWRVLSWRSMPQPDGLMYATARDVTDTKTTEQALREAKQTLEDRVLERTGELAQANQALQEQLARLALLSRIDHAIGERQDLTSIFGVVVATIEEQLPSDIACILTYDEADATLSITSQGPRTVALTAGVTAEMRTIARDSSGLAVCLDGQLVYEPQLAAPASPLLQHLAQLGIASVVAAPLRNEGWVLGVMLVARRTTQGFAPGELDFLRQLGEHVALAARQAQLYGALQAAYDDLRLSQQTVMQQERLRVLGQMASGIAHDINNSISPVTLYAKLLERERGLSEQGREFLRIIQQSVRDVSDTVARMREFYRPVDPQQAFTAVQLNKLLPELVNLTRARWSDMPQERGIVVRMQLELGANLSAVRGIESEIREALTNLIFNAVDAMPEGGTVTLRTVNGQSDSSTMPTVDVEVSDTGVGMDAQTLRRCLEPFFTTKGERGSGLGLAMVYGIVQRHGGNIAVDSQPGHGTTVRLSFLAAASSDERGAAAGEEPIVVRPLRLLIVDDDAVVLKALRDMLEAEGHSVTAFGDGRKAIAAFASHPASAAPFDVVITDLGMPHVDGRQVAAAVKAAAPATPVILLTGWGRLMAETDVPRHVDRVLSKPPKIRELQSALANVAAAAPAAAHET